LLSRGGFELHKWKTNIASMQEKGRLLDISRDHESKLLGVLWDPEKDVLYYKNPISKFENSVTKRIIKLINTFWLVYDKQISKFNWPKRANSRSKRL